jgi:hypothetical protein
MIIKKAKALAFAAMVLIAGFLVVTMVATAIKAAKSDVGALRRLPDGSTLLLREAVFTATNSYTYTHQSGNKLLRFLAPILPGSIARRFNLAGGSFGFGIDGNTNLIVITVNRSGSSSRGSSVGRLQVFDNPTNAFDACWGANTLGLPTETVHGWTVRAFPRRGRFITLRLLMDPDGVWTQATDFRIQNPLHSDFPQWTAESSPIRKADGDLGVTLSEFQCGAPMARRRPVAPGSILPRKTRLVFAFDEQQHPSDNWRVQKLTISDATGNCWSPYLDFVDQDFNWSTNGTVEFFGALWPAENAWKLDLEVIQTGGFKPVDLWEIPIELPVAAQVTSLTNFWNHEGHSITLVALAAPNTDHAGDFKWVAKWWGQDRNSVYSLALKTDGDFNGWRLTVVRAVDQTGAEVKLVQHGNQDYPKQAVFLKPGEGAKVVRLTLALQKSRFVHFLAHPQFVE